MSEVTRPRPPAVTSEIFIPRQRRPSPLETDPPAPAPPSAPAPAPTEPGSARAGTGPVVPRDKLRCLFGLPVAALRLEEVVELADAAMDRRSGLMIGVLNAAKVVKLRHDASLRASLLDCDLLLADGQSVVWAGTLLGQPLPQRVAGIDLFVALLDLADRDGRRIYLLGARQPVLDQLLENIAARWPGAVVVGSRNGYFTTAESAAVAADIGASGAEMLFLGMPTPRKEIFLDAYAVTTGASVLHGVGGSFDVLAGVTRRAPERWQRMGLEWAYRLLQEPRRLGRRYLVTNTAFIGLVMRERLLPQASYESTSATGGS